jgi:hypothetical protein
MPSSMHQRGEGLSLFTFPTTQGSMGKVSPTPFSSDTADLRTRHHAWGTVTPTPFPHLVLTHPQGHRMHECETPGPCKGGTWDGLS